MTDSLRDKIIETLTFSPGLHPEGRSDIEVAADAVIAELGLTQQWLVDGIISDGVPRPWEVPCETRWTTEWERFDG